MGSRVRADRCGASAVPDRVRLLLFGGRTVTDEQPFAALLDAACPDLLIHGACGLDEDDPIDGDKMRGADGIAHRLAEARGIPIDPRPAAWKRLGKPAGMRRNEDMFRLRPTHAAGRILGPRGSPMSPGSAGMARICMRGLPGRPPIPLVLYRDDGLELPPGSLRPAYDLLRLLYRSTPEVAAAGKAARCALDAEAAGASAGDVAALTAGARGEVEMVMREQPRAAPWLAVAVGLLGRATG